MSDPAASDESHHAPSPDASRKNLTKRAKKGNCDYPLVTIAFYGPDDRTATKVSVGYLAFEGADAEVLRRWRRGEELRGDNALWDEIAAIIRPRNPVSIVMFPDRIFGCPHEAGTDFAEWLPECSYCDCWRGRDRFAGLGRRAVRAHRLPATSIPNSIATVSSVDRLMSPGRRR